MSESPTIRLPEATEAPPRRRRRGRTLTIVLVIVVVLLVVLAVAAEFAARSYATGYIRDRVTQIFAIDDPSSLEIGIGGGSLLLQAVTGRVAEVTIDAPELAVGELTGSAEVIARGIPLDDTQPAESLDVDFTLDEDQFAALAAAQVGLAPEDVTLVDGAIALQTEFDLGVAVVPVAAELVPGLVDGQVAFSARSITVAGSTLTEEELTSGPLASVVGSLLQPGALCVAQFLPPSIEATDLVIGEDGIRATLAGRDVVLGGGALEERGSCAGG